MDKVLNVKDHMSSVKNINLKSMDFKSMSLKMDMGDMKGALKFDMMQSGFNNLIGKKGERNVIQHDDYKDLYRTAD